MIIGTLLGLGCFFVEKFLFCAHIGLHMFYIPLHSCLIHIILYYVIYYRPLTELSHDGFFDWLKRFSNMSKFKHIKP